MTRAEVEICHAAHRFPYYLGKSRDESKRSLGCNRDVLGQGEERGALQVHISRSKSCFSQLKNPNQSALQHGHPAPRSAYTLGPWLFYFGTLDGRKHRTRVEIRFQWTPNHQITDGVTIETLPSSLETPPKPKFLMNEDTGKFIQDGDIFTLRTVDPIKKPLPSLELLNLQCYLVRVLRLAGRAGGDMLETVESDIDLSSVAASDDLETDINASSSQTAFE